MSLGSRIGQQLSQSPRGAGEYICGDPPENRQTFFKWKRFDGKMFV